MSERDSTSAPGNRPAGTVSQVLPEPDAVAQQHSARLRALVDVELAAGPMSFARYMQHALYEPGLGYYMAGARKFGEQGDFTTAPEVSPLFGQCLARQCAEVLGLQGGAILELGAGSGALAESVLLALREDSCEQYLILEPSAELQHRQKQRLQASLPASLCQRLRWIDRLPEAFRGVMLANEVADALPFERILVDEAGMPCQLVIERAGLDDTGAWRWRERTQTPPPALRDILEHLQADLPERLPPGYLSEVSTLLGPWVRSLASALEQGVLLVIDYGQPRRDYYHPERRHGTLGCYYRHRRVDDPYRYPGLQDITADVDFTALVENASAAGMSLLGYANQGTSLVAMGLAVLAEAAMQAAQDEKERYRVAQSVRTLSLPGEMGERFQCMALGKGYDRPLTGFTTGDLSHRL